MEITTTITTRNIASIKDIHDDEKLIMRPPFQRNLVWSISQKSLLIDSILNGYPIPELYMQETVNEDGKQNFIVVDGQQRINACLEYLDGKFSIITIESPQWTNKKFEDLSVQDKKKIYAYNFIVRVLPETTDKIIRRIFQRLNKNVVSLNKQELRQSLYGGPFLKTMVKIANFPYWSSTGIFTPMNIRRMMDVEYISELSIAILHGHQNKKETIDKYYLLYEEKFKDSEKLIEVFNSVISELDRILPDIKTTRWKKKTDFYSLFIYLARHENALPMNHAREVEFLYRIHEFGKEVDAFVSSTEPPRNPDRNVEKYGKSIRASSDRGNRIRRHEALEELLDDLFILHGAEMPPPRIQPTED